MLVLAPPFVEAYRVGLERDTGHDSGAVAGIVDIELEAHIALVIIRVGPAQLAFEGIEDFDFIDVKNLFTNNHLVDAYRVHTNPNSHLESLRSLFSVQSQLIARIIELLRVQRRYGCLIFHWSII